MTYLPSVLGGGGPGGISLLASVLQIPFLGLPHWTQLLMATSIHSFVTSWGELNGGTQNYIRILIPRT